MIIIMTQSLLVYFIYIFIDIIIYALASISWFSRIFWMVGRVIADSSFGLPSLCGLVPWVLILITETKTMRTCIIAMITLTSDKLTR
jgi:hypothetical protein